MTVLFLIRLGIDWDCAEQAETGLWIELLCTCLTSQKTEWVKEEDGGLQNKSVGEKRIWGRIAFFLIVDIFRWE